MKRQLKQTVSLSLTVREKNFELLCHCDCPVKTKSVRLVTTAHIWFGPIVVMRSDKRSDMDVREVWG